MPCWQHHKLCHLHRYYYHHHTTTVLRPFFWDNPGEPVPKRKLLDFMVHGKTNSLTEADTPTIRMGATPSELAVHTSTIPSFFTGQMPFLPPNQHSQTTEGN